jgi:hypothetical protein
MPPKIMNVEVVELAYELVHGSFNEEELASLRQLSRWSPVPHRVMLAGPPREARRTARFAALVKRTLVSSLSKG